MRLEAAYGLSSAQEDGESVFRAALRVGPTAADALLPGRELRHLYAEW